MRYTAIAAVGFVTAEFLLSSGVNIEPSVAAQPPAGAPEVSPKIVAFLKPVEGGGWGHRIAKKKLKERHNVGVKLLEERVNEYKKGLRDSGPVFEAARLAAEAKLDLAENAPARIAVLEQTLDIAKLIESHLQQQIDKGLGSKSDLERARFARLGVEFELLRAKQKDAPKPK